MRVGLLGGVFNPPHIGHLVLAQEALAQLALEKVVWVPVGRAPHRDVPHDPGPEARFTMCECATAGDERFSLSRFEVDRDEPSYTVDTLRALATARPDDEPVLLLGADQAAALPRWHEPEEVLRLAEVAVVARGEQTRADVRAALAPLAGGERVSFFDMPRIDVSSTLVRERAAVGLPIRYLVPDKVASFIGAQSLYGAAAGVTS